MDFSVGVEIGLPTFVRGNREQATGNSKDFWVDAEIVACFLNQQSKVKSPASKVRLRGTGFKSPSHANTVACCLLPLILNFVR